MNFLKVIKSGLKVANQGNPTTSLNFKRFKRVSSCDICLNHPEKKPCFDIRNVSIEFGNQCHAKMIRSFLYTHYWTREPSVVALWMSLNCPYLDILTDKYCHSGDRFLAFERIQRTGERKLVGVCVANQVHPWMIDELEEWAHYTASNPERNRMYFTAHCLKNPKFFQQYNVDYIYDIEVLATAADVTGQGVATMLLRAALAHAHEMRHTLAQVVATSYYTSKVCEKAGMKRDWAMNYDEFVDDCGRRVFFPRRPHETASIYVKYYDPTKGGEKKTVIADVEINEDMPNGMSS